MKQDGQRAAALKKLTDLFRKYKLVLLVLVVGVALLLWPHSEGTEAAAESVAAAGVEFDLEELEGRMERILSRIEGAGEVSVLLTLKSGTEQVYATDVERSQDAGGFEENVSTVLISTGSGTETAAVLRQDYPAFQGALVVCDGGNDPSVKLLITQAVAALTGLGADKITVCR